MNFLEKYELRRIPLNLQIVDLNPLSLFLGEGSQPIEIASFSSSKRPTNAKAQEAFKKRRAKRAAAVLIVITHPEGVTLCGTSGEEPPVYYLRDKDQVERLCAQTLEKKNKSESIKFLSDAIPSLNSNLPGILNEGFLSDHELEKGVKEREDWIEACNKSKEIIGKNEINFLFDLGFESRRLDNLSDILSSGEEEIAIKIFLEEGELPQIANSRFNNISPISYSLTKAEKLEIPWIFMFYRNGIRIYSTKNLGVARRSRVETFIECQPNLLSNLNSGLLWILFSAKALKKDGIIYEVLSNSKRFSVNIAESLRERIYEIIIPKLALGISNARDLINPSKDEIALTYEMALTVLFRLLFIAYAEDRDLLPYKNNQSYKKKSLKQKAIELSKNHQYDQSLKNEFHHWNDVCLLWESISEGNRELGIPAYEGTIFACNKEINLAGSEIAKIKVSNEFFEEALRYLLLSETNKKSFSPIDFRSLSVREFGTIYEGLLASELSLAEQNLKTDKKGNYLPAKDNEKPLILKGEIYLHDRSGARKSSGSFYTPDFAVEHILDGALETALNDHLKKMSELSQADCAEQFFNFKVADIAMGSGHFLVAAIDRIERRFAIWLSDNPNPAIQREILYLRTAAKKELGDLSDTVVIEDSQLLRRIIARKCIYGVDLNPITVQLARLSIWIHTFVPGLPLSLLDHNLVNGNALVGIDSLDEVRKKFNNSLGTLFQVDTEKLIGEAAAPLRKLAKLSDATLRDIKEGRSLLKEALEKIKETEALCDLIIAQPVSEDQSLKNLLFEDWEYLRKNILTSAAFKAARKILKPLKVLHFPIAFPEVFLGKSSGFNVILGNPPWEEIKAEERDYWTGLFPGLRGLSQKDQIKSFKEISLKRPDLRKRWLEIESSTNNLARILKSGNFPGLEVGDFDLYKAFCWRFWNISSNKIGKIGIVLPRSTFAAKGSELFRKELFKTARSIDITTLQNTGKWIFDIHPQYTIALTCLSKTDVEKEGISIRGPFNSFSAYSLGCTHESLKFSVNEVLSWTDDGALPLLRSNYSANIFRQIRKAPRLDLLEENEWRARPDAELHATNQKYLMDLTSDECPDDFWPVYKGGSYDIWESDRNEYYAWADPKKVLPWLQEKRLRAFNSSRDSVHKEFTQDYIEDPKTLAPLRPKIAFRLITRSSDSRTMRAALTPPKAFHSNSSQIVMMTNGDEKDEAFLLAVLSSIPLDWYARCFVEVNFNFFLFNPLPIPRPNRENYLWQRAVKISGRLASIDIRFKEWAKNVGVDYGPLESETKFELICELDAIISHLYELNEKQLNHIFETFHKGWDYEARLKKILKFFHIYENRN